MGTYKRRNKVKKGFNQTLHNTLIPAQYEIIYNVGMVGITIHPLFMDRWNDLPGWKRGIIHQPVLSTTEDVNGNATHFLNLLNDLQYGEWNNGIPLIVDIWEAKSAETMYSLDHAREHGIYITENYKPKTKPLLRIILTLWNAWMKSNSTETLRLLHDYNILLCQPSVTKPNELASVGIPAWWEYGFGMYVNDPSLLYDGVVKPPVVLPPVDEEPEPEDPPINSSISFPKKWKVNITISGTIEAEDN